jgi:ABC-type Fe3+ transport system substrate-binding protein
MTMNAITEADVEAFELAQLLADLDRPEGASPARAITFGTESTHFKKARALIAAGYRSDRRRAADQDFKDATRAWTDRMIGGGA